MLSRVSLFRPLATATSRSRVFQNLVGFAHSSNFSTSSEFKIPSGGLKFSEIDHDIKRQERAQLHFEAKTKVHALAQKILGKVSWSTKDMGDGMNSLEDIKFEDGTADEVLAAKAKLLRDVGVEGRLYPGRIQLLNVNYQELLAKLSGLIPDAEKDNVKSFKPGSR